MAAYTEVTNENVFQRLGHSIKNILVGLILFAIAFPLLWWNEGRAVARYKDLEEGAGKVAAVSADAVDSDNEGGLVHLSGMTATDAVLEDPVFGISENAIRLGRDVRMFQWEENSHTESKTKVGGSKKTETNYTYEKDWSSRVIDSSQFKEAGHTNPSTMSYQGQEWVANDVRLGAFRLSPEFVGQITASEEVSIDEAAVERISSVVGRSVQRFGDALFVGNSTTTPEIGDLKISFSRTPVAEISAVGKQQGELLTTYNTERGGKLQLLKMGRVTPEAMFAAAEQENRIITWLVRLLGFILMAAGIGTIFAPLAVMGDVIPFIGSMMRMGTGVVAGVLAFALSLITIAVAWLAYRPVLGIALLALALAAVVGARHLAGGKEPLPPPPPPPPPPG